MTVTVDGNALGVATLRFLVLAGGDYNALLVDDGVQAETDRGLHLLVKYVAPLNHFYANWHGRVLTAIRDYINHRKQFLNSYNVSLQTGVTLAGAYHEGAWSRENVSTKHIATTTGMPMLGDYNRRREFRRAEGRAAAQTRGSVYGHNRYIVDYDDLRNMEDKLIQFFAAQGATSAESVGDALEYSGQSFAIRAKQRQYLEDVAKFKADKATAAAKADSEDSSGLGSLFATAVSIGSKLFL